MLLYLILVSQYARTNTVDVSCDAWIMRITLNQLDRLLEFVAAKSENWEGGHIREAERHRRAQIKERLDALERLGKPVNGGRVRKVQPELEGMEIDE